MATAVSVFIEIVRLNNPGPVLGLVYYGNKCVGRVHLEDNEGLVFVPEGSSRLNAELLIAIAEILNHWAS
jgi:hypothetical protein